MKLDASSVTSSIVVENDSLGEKTGSIHCHAKASEHSMQLRDDNKTLTASQRKTHV
jgi:hypothetical protein